MRMLLSQKRLSRPYLVDLKGQEKSLANWEEQDVRVCRDNNLSIALTCTKVPHNIVLSLLHYDIYIDLSHL